MVKTLSEEEKRKRLRRSLVRRLIAVGMVVGLLIVLMLVANLFDIFPPLWVIVDPFLLHAIGVSGAFVSAYLLLACLLSINASRRAPQPPAPKTLAMPLKTEESMTLQGILLGEFAYARETAAQAMEERRSVTNFYLLTVGGALTGVVALLSTIATRNSLALGAVAALWLVCMVGLLTLFSIISLRLAWVGSASAMGYIKAFYLANADRLGATPDILQSAFSFQPGTIPSPGAHWNVNHFAILLVALLDSAAFLAGLVLMAIVSASQDILPLCLVGSLLGALIFLAHWWSYDLSLTPK